MASPALGSLEGGGGGTLPPATQPVSSPMPSNGHASRPPSEPRGTAANSEPRTSQPPMPSPSLPQGQYMNRGPTPTNNTLPQKSIGEGKDVSSSDEYLQLSNMIKTARPDVVRRVVRDHSQRCLTGSDFHVGFILNTTLHHASPSLLDQAVKDFGAQLVSATKHRWVQHLGPNDLDEIADALFQRASDRFLDRALARRFETISGRALVNALARAERLGYDTRDIVEEKDANKQEHVIPSPLPPTTGVFRTNGPHASQAPPQAPPQTPQYQQQPQRPVYQEPQPVFLVLRHSAEQIASAKPLGIVFCDVCGRPCSGPSALDNHLKKRACANHVTKMDRFGTETCAHCGVSFSSVGGLAYHNKSAVCGVYTPNVNNKMMELLAQRARTPNPKPAATNSMPQQGPNPGYQTPTQPAAARPTVRPDIADQYAGLSPQNQTQFDAEMKSAEDYYGQQMRDAMALPQPQADIELGKIKNRLNSRQSNLRKKYGIRLRERRTREQIEMDNARIARASSTGTPPVSTPPMGTPQQGQSASVSGVKRPLSSHDDSPRKRVPLSEMSGLSGAAASAEMTDPTLNRMPPATPSSLPPKPSSSLPPKPPPPPQQQQQQLNTPSAPPSSLPARPPQSMTPVPPSQAPTAPMPKMGSGNGPDNPVDIDSTTSEGTGTPQESGAISGAPEADNGVGSQAEHGESKSLGRNNA